MLYIRGALSYLNLHYSGKTCEPRPTFYQKLVTVIFPQEKNLRSGNRLLAEFSVKNKKNKKTKTTTNKQTNKTKKNKQSNKQKTKKQNKNKQTNKQKNYIAFIKLAL